MEQFTGRGQAAHCSGTLLPHRKGENAVSVTNFKTNFVVGRRNVNIAKLLSVLWGGVFGVWQTTPLLIRDSVTVAVLFFTLDTFSGFVRACFEGRMRSRSLPTGAVKKGLQYMLLTCLFGGFGLIAHNPMLIMPALGIVIMTEASSIIENVYWMQQGGAQMPVGLREMVQRMGRYLATEAMDAKPEPEKEVAK